MLSISHFPLEIKESICHWLIHGQHIHDDEEENASWGIDTVFLLASTSKAFHEPALNALWQIIPSVALLFYTLPRECYTRARMKGYEHYTRFKLARPLQESDFTRFHLYSRRVKVLRRDAACVHLYPKIRYFFIHHQSLSELGEFATAHGWKILPNVRELDYCRGVPNSLQICRYLHFLCGPKLRVFNVKTYSSLKDTPQSEIHSRPGDHVDHEEAVIDMCASLSKNYPQLREFSIGVNPSSMPIVSAVIESICSFKHLANLRCCGTTLPLPVKAFVHIALLPSLRTFSFAATDIYWTNSQFWLLDHKPRPKLFPALQELGIVTLSSSFAAKLLSYVGSRRLTRLVLKVVRDIPRKDVLRLLEAIGNIDASDVLEHLYILLDVMSNDGQPGDPAPITGKTLQPLYALDRLTRIQLDIHCPWGVDDGDLHEMAYTWPMMTVLELGIERPWRGSSANSVLELPPPRPTFYGLLMLSRCLQLKTLGLEWNTDVNSPEALMVQEDFSRPRPDICMLGRLRIGLSRVLPGDEYRVSGLLARLFLDLKIIETGWGALWREERTRAQERKASEGEAYVADMSVAERMRSYLDIHTRWQAISQFAQECGFVRYQERNWYFSNYERGYTPSDEE